MGGYLLSLFLVLFLVALSTGSLPVLESGYPPSITQGPARLQYIDKGYTIPLVCEAEGSPKPSYTWIQNPGKYEKYIKCGDYPKYICDDDGKVIAIVNVSATGDYGKYQCFVSNHFGSTMSSVFEVKSYSVRGTYDITTGRTAEMNSGMRIDCPAGLSEPSYGDKGKYGNFIYPTHAWNIKKDYYNTPIYDVETSERVQIHIYNGSLYFLNFEKAETWLYKCLRKVGKTEVEDSGHVNLTVKDAELKDFAPYNILATMIPQYYGGPPSIVLEGESVQFQCLFAGRPTPIMSAANWTKDDGSLPLERVTFSEYFTQMKIFNIQPSDAGTYRCGDFSISKSFTIGTKAAPRFDFEYNTPYSRNVTDGDTVTLNCKPYSNPKSSVQWYKNGVELNPDDLPPKYSMSEDRTELTISPVCRDCGQLCGSISDLMSVQCKATNEYGSSLVQGYLNVLTGVSTAPTTPAPSPTPGTVMCYNCEGSADSDCGVNVNSSNVESVYCFAGSCATFAFSSTDDNAISKVSRGCGKSEYIGTNCIAQGAEMMCIKTCTGTRCNGDLPSRKNG